MLIASSGLLGLVTIALACPCPAWADEGNRVSLAALFGAATDLEARQQEEGPDQVGTSPAEMHIMASARRKRRATYEEAGIFVRGTLSAQPKFLTGVDLREGFSFGSFAWSISGGLGYGSAGLVTIEEVKPGMTVRTEVPAQFILFAGSDMSLGLGPVDLLWVSKPSSSRPSGSICTVGLAATSSQRRINEMAAASSREQDVALALVAGQLRRALKVRARLAAASELREQVAAAAGSR